MLKRIPVQQLRLGMYIHEFCGSWMEHPFWRGAFLLDDPKDLKIICTIGLAEVWIDTSKGHDVEGGASTAAVAAEVDAALAQVDSPGKPEPRAGIAQEAARAVKICAKSKQAVASMFHEARMGKALDVGDALPIVEEISTSVMRNPGALISLARLKNKDEYTYMHSVAVCALMVALARTMGFNDLQTRQAGLAGLLHDVGKMMIPTSILDKPGKLTEAEFETMKSHPVEGHRMLLEGSGIGEIALDVCLHHHEKVDGSGYPHGLAGGEISMYARMGAVCDVYDAITSNRPYKNGWEPAESIRKMAEWSKGHFDQRIFEAFVRSVGIYPIGSLVRLESDHLGVVVEQTAQSLLRPILMVFFSIKSNARMPPELLDLSKPACKDKIVSHEDPLKWDIRDTQALWSGMEVTPW
ncbi:MAG: phosphodiesterase [Gallionellales bacterium GWA2_59_43]|nr:MAG: phosphodiesterase [Gallionellales bacterium GWA2_59_43]